MELGLERAALTRPMTVEVDERVAEHAVEPRHRALAVLNRAALLKRSDKCGLKDLLGRRATWDPGFEEGQKLSMVRHEAVDGRPHSRTLRSLSAFPMTETELNAIAALASMGLKSNPKKG